MNTRDRAFDKIKKLVIKLDGITRAEEHHDLFILLPFDESVKYEEPLLDGAHQISCTIK